MKLRKTALVLLLAFCLTLLSGCWNYRDFDSLTMVSAFAIDPGTQGNKYHATFEFLDETGERPKAKVLETEGNTLFETVRNATSINNKRLFFSTCRVFIINHDLAQQGVASLFDFLMRDSEPRITLYPLISKEKTAGEILLAESGDNQLIGLNLGRLLEENPKTLSNARVIQLYQAYAMITAQGQSLTLPCLKLDDTGGKKVPKLDGTAVFRGDVMIGSLSRKETQYLLYAIGKIDGGLLLTRLDGMQDNISLEILGSHTLLSPFSSNGKNGIRINIRTKSDIGENQSTKNLNSVAAVLKTQSAAENTIQQGVSTLIQKVQREYRSDIFGFGKEFHESMPAYWKQIKDNWDDTFSSTPFEVNANMTIQGTATANGNWKADS